MLPNPYRDDEHSHSWFHGTNADIDDLDSTKHTHTSPFANNGVMTNKLLGTHFSPLYSVARSFVHPDRDAKVFHAHLDMDNPAHFPDENHLNRAIFHHAVKHFPGFAESTSTHHDGTNAEFAAKHAYASDETLNQGAGSRAIYQRHRDAAMENTIREHHDQKGIAKSFVDHLHASGHDGITYGNVFEGPVYHTCAIATDPDRIHVQKISHMPATMDAYKAPVPMGDDERRHNSILRQAEDDWHGESPEQTTMVHEMHNANHDYGAPYNHSPDAPWGKSYTETHKLGMSDEDYRMQHRPPSGDGETGAPFHDPDGVMPGIHAHPEHYGTNRHYGNETISQLRAAKGDPDHPVTIYRALPRPHTTFRPGDWVTPSSRYADAHRYSEGNEEGDDRDWHVIKATVPAKHLHSHGDSPHEWGYTGPDTLKGEVHYDGPRRPGADYQDEWERENRPNPQRMTAALLDNWPQLVPHEWYHGSKNTQHIERFDPADDPYADSMATKHWNCHLGTHFSQHHSVAREIGTSHGGRVYHATLDMKNPKHYDSEFDLDREALQHHLNNGESFKSDSDSVGSPYQMADTLTGHPKSEELAHRFKQHLISQGHDGVTYGNECEGPKGHTCAIAFHPEQIHITDTHLGHQGCRLHGPASECCGGEVSPDGRCEECGTQQRPEIAPHTAARKPVRRDPKTGIEMCHKKVYGFPCKFLLGHAQSCDVDWDAAYPDEEEDSDGSHREAGRRQKGRPQDQAPREDPASEVADQGAARQGPATLIFHPGVAKDRKRLDHQVNRKVDEVLDSIANGTAGPQTHAMGANTPLKGWNATRVNHQVRITHQPGENGEILIGHIGQHNYDDAIRRLTSLDYHQMPLHPDLPTGMPDRGIIKGNPQLPIFRALAVEHGDPDFDEHMDNHLGKSHEGDQAIAHRLMGHISEPKSDRGVKTSVGLHWTHDQDWAEDYAHTYHSEWTHGEGTHRPVVVEAHHPGLEHAMSWDNPGDHKPLTKTVGEQQYDSAMLGEVPIRPGAPLHIKALHVAKSDGSFHRIPLSMHHQAARLSDQQKADLADHFEQFHPHLDATNPMADWVHRAEHHQRGERALGPRRAEPLDAHPHPDSIDPYRASTARESGLVDPHHGTGPWFHGTNADLSEGDTLQPGDIMGKAHGDGSDGSRVWVSNDARRAGAYGHRLYEVTPHSRPRSPYANHDEHHTSGATVVREVPWSEVQSGSLEKQAAVRDVRSADSEAGAEDGIMIALVPPKDLAERLSIEGGESPEQIHVTIAYLGKTGDYTQEQLEQLPVEVEEWAKTQEPLEATVQGAGTFVAAEEGGKHVLWASVDCPGLERLHVSLVDHLLAAGYEPSQNHVFVPHLTLSYEKHHVRFLPKIARENWTVHEIWVCVGGLWESLPLTVNEGASA